MKKILIVEDDTSISEELKNLLDNAGFNGVILKDFENSFEEIKTYCLNNNLSLPEFVKKFDDSDIEIYLQKVFEVMKNSINRGLNTQGFLPGKLKVERKKRK